MPMTVLEINIYAASDIYVVGSKYSRNHLISDTYKPVKSF
jgi:hypothetical protein